MSFLFQRVSGHAFEAGDRPFAGAGSSKAGRWPPTEPPLPHEPPLLPISSVARLSTTKKLEWEEEGAVGCCSSAWSLEGRGQSGSPSLWTLHVADVERGEGTLGSSSTETFFLLMWRVSDNTWYPSLSPIFQQKVSIQRALDASPRSPWVFPALAYQFLKLLINNSKGDPIKLVLSSWVGPASLHLSRSLLLIPAALKRQWDKLYLKFTAFAGKTQILIIVTWFYGSCCSCKVKSCCSELGNQDHKGEDWSQLCSLWELLSGDGGKNLQ